MVVISRVIGPPIGVITIVTLLITPLITTHEPPSKNTPPLQHTFQAHTYFPSKTKAGFALEVPSNSPQPRFSYYPNKPQKYKLKLSDSH